jgi:hypothetical protein
MTRIPELTFTYDADTYPVSAKCGICGEEMPHEVERRATSSEDIQRFAAQFDLHMKQKHLTEYRIHGHREA